MGKKPVIFVSSTSDLDAERRALAKELTATYEPYFYEDDRARAASPESHCRRMIRSSNVFIGILGPRYGTSYDANRSIVEWEFEVAREKPPVAVMAFLKVAPDDASVEPNQRPFLARLAAFHGGVWGLRFSSPMDLARKVRASVQTWLVESWGQVSAAERKADRRMTVVIGTAMALALALSVWLALPASTNEVSGNAKFALWFVSGFLLVVGSLLLFLPRGPESTEE